MREGEIMNDDFWSLWPGVILGREGDEDADNGNSQGDEDPDNGDGTDGNSSDSSNQEQTQTEGTEKTAEDFAKLEKALAAERRNNKKLERENRRLSSTSTQKAEEENQDIEAERQKSQAAQAKAEKLAAGLLRRDIDNAIRQAARSLKFIDEEDAVAGVHREDIIADQDDEDPTDIEVDLDSVTRAVKALAAKKPHFLNRGTDDGEPTGSARGGSRKPKPTTEEQLREHYPAL
jgi:hypothetical protein